MRASTSALSAPRRRFRSPAPPVAFPTVDLIGPPCPLSNLRPVYYAPLFPSPPPPTTPFNSLPSGAPHPYSLAEFPSGSSSLFAETAASPSRAARLLKVQQDLHAKDLEWRLARYRLDAFNQDFWARTNGDFLRRRDEYFVAHAHKEGEYAGQGEDVDLSGFYKEHLERTKRQYADYNRKLWAMQAAQMWPALKAVWRPWKWRWELWKAGMSD